MKIRILLSLLLAVCICALSSCALSETAANRSKINALRIGMTGDQVRAVMGEPLTGEVYNTPRVWYYYTRVQWYDGNITRDECTPLVFDEDGHLEGWGQDYFKTHYTYGDWTKKPVGGVL